VAHGAAKAFPWLIKQCERGPEFGNYLADRCEVNGFTVDDLSYEFLIFHNVLFLSK
jgi:hypothetical protein